MGWFLFLVFFWAIAVAWTYMIFYYESANGSHLEVLRNRGSVCFLLLKGFLWSFLSHLLVLTAALSALHRRFWRFPTGATSRPPVIFVHGLYHNHTAWYFYMRSFRRWGWRYLKAVNLPGKLRSIEEHALTLADEVDRVIQRSGSGQVDLVGHSMGGLVIRAYLSQNLDEAKVRRVVTLGCPHSGSKLAVFAPGVAAREMVPGSSFLESLNGSGLQVPKQGRLYSIYTILDNMVLPNESAKVTGEGVICKETRPINHVGLLFCNQTAKLVRECLEEP
jgi:triacylglycerol lipase